MKQSACLFCFAALLMALASCKSTKVTVDHQELATPLPPLPTELPVINYKSPGIRHEFESMLLYRFQVFADKEASGGFAARLLDDSSTAQVKISFPEGTYECLVSEKATDSAHAPFYVYLDKVPYRVYPSDPPLGSYELTTRVPIYFTLEEPRTILVTVQANSEHKIGSTGMSLDYIQFIKRN